MCERVPLDEIAAICNFFRMEQRPPNYSAALSPEDRALDHLWRQRFDQPLPIIGASDVVQTILKKDGVTDDEIKRAVARYTSSD